MTENMRPEATSAQPRDFFKVVDAILVVAPDLTDWLTPIRKDATFTAMEGMPMRWQQLQDTLNVHATKHPKRDEINVIFSGEPKQ